MKECNKCREVKKIEDFYKERNQCKECQKAYIKEWQSKNPDKVKVTRKKWRDGNPEWTRNATVVYNHRRRTRGGTLLPTNMRTIVFEFYGEVCMRPGCGAETRLQIDHVVPVAKGGTNDWKNLQVLCKPCNSSKRDWHSEDYRDYTKGILVGMAYGERMVLRHYAVK